MSASDSTSNSLDQQAKLRWVKEGYKAALKALNQSDTSNPGLLLQGMEDASFRLLQESSSDAAMHEADQMAPDMRLGHALSRRPAAQAKRPALAGSGASGCSARQPCTSAAEAGRVWAGFAKQQDAIKFADACNSAVQAAERQVGRLPPFRC